MGWSGEGVARPLGRLGRGRGGTVVVDGLGDERGRDALLDGLLGHDALLDAAAGRRRDLEVEQGLLDDRARAAGAGLALQREARDRDERLVGEHQLDAVELEEAL